MTVEIGFKVSDYIPDLSQYIPVWIPPFFRDRIVNLLATIRGNVVALIDTQQTNIENKLGNLADNLAGPLRPIVQVVTQLHTTGLDFFSKGETLFTTARTEYEGIRDFKIKTAWKGRVVSVTNTIKQIHAIAEAPARVANAVKDLVQEVRDKVQQGFNPDEVFADLEGAEDLSGLLAKIGPKFLKAGQRILGILALVLDTLVTVNATLDDLQIIVNELHLVRDDIENLDLVFLQQNNPRKLLTLDDGRTIKVRIGRLHPA